MLRGGACEKPVLWGLRSVCSSERRSLVRLWVGRRSGRPFGLPSRCGTDEHIYPWGNTSPSDQACWGRDTFCAVGSFPFDHHRLLACRRTLPGAEQVRSSERKGQAVHPTPAHANTYWSSWRFPRGGTIARRLPTRSPSEAHGRQGGR